MKTPFQILGIGPDADDDRIRQAYLGKVKEFPPDREPKKFTEIQRAYEQVKDLRARLAYELFHLPTVEEYQQLIHRLHPRRPSLEQFRALLNDCLEQQQKSPDGQ